MDDLLDLDFASSNKPQPKQTAQSAYTGRTAFDYLAASSQPSYRAPSPALQPTRTPTPQTARPASVQPKAGGGDAFAELFGTSTASKSDGGQQGLSMAERLHKESAAKIGGYGGMDASNGGPYASTGQSGAGSRAGSPALPQPLRVASPSSSLLTPTSASSRSLTPSSAAPSPAAPSKPADVWDFDLLGSAVPASSAAPPAKNDDPFDLGFDSLPSSSQPPSASSAATPAPHAAATGADDFDLLDAFASPAPPASSRPSPSSAPSPPSARSSSPPPHILGHLVEMGFAPAKARSALLATAKPDGGWDAEAAVDTLMGNVGSTPSAPAPTAREGLQETPEERRRRERQQREEDEWGEEDNVRVGRRRSWEFEDDDRAAAAQAERELRERRAAAERRRAAGGERTEQPGERRMGKEPVPPSTSAAADPNDPTAQLQQQATAALATAQKLGFSMFNRANQMWGQGKEALQKVVEEQRAAARVAAGLPGATAAAGGESKGKPKWWREGMDDELPSQEGARAKGKQREEPWQSSFKDSDDEGADPVLPQRPAPRQQQQKQAPHPAVPAAASAPATSEYRSPFRRAKPAPPPAPEAAAEGDLLSGSAPPSRASPSPAPSPRSAPPPGPSASSTPRRPPSRPQIPVSPSALSAALAHKTAGNEHFKLGRFGDASAAYSLALDALPPSWLGRVPLLNNRAQARLRSGEEKLAAADCSEALAILGEADLPALEAESGQLSPEVAQIAGSALDLKDQLGKSLGRRAKALEAVEKWTKASEDWEKLLRLGDETVLKGAGGRKLVNEGAARCRKMLGGGSAPSSAPSSSASSRPSATPVPRPAAARPRPPPVPVEASGDAVRALQAQQAQQAAEDDLRLSLKDSVDARIGAWKGGKEANLRALIASLENVLWPELGWKKVGMHELISEGALKVRYVRAIAKVHPDKLNVNNTTVEQRMIAGLVFAALNDAWNAMK
ncbi:hypothetical protein JCM10213_009279 [Rhodosporidiobolus nylandii]